MTGKLPINLNDLLRQRTDDRPAYLIRLPVHPLAESPVLEVTPEVTLEVTQQVTEQVAEQVTDCRRRARGGANE